MEPLKMYFLLKMGIFQPAMLVYQRVIHFYLFQKTVSMKTHVRIFLNAFHNEQNHFRKCSGISLGKILNQGEFRSLDEICPFSTGTPKLPALRYN